MSSEWDVKRGIKPQKIEALIDETLKTAGMKKEQIFALASIDKKQDEQGFFNLEQTAQSTVFDLYGKRTAKSAGKLSCLCFCRVTGWGWTMSVNGRHFVPAKQEEH